MEFKVYSRSGETTDFYHGESEYSIDDGVLTVRSEHGNTIVYGPSSWERVEHETVRGTPHAF